MNADLSNKTIIVTGASGQLAQSLALETKKESKATFIYLSRADFDITSEAAIKSVIEKYRPDFIINTAAYTQVDAAESNQENAFLINEKAVRSLAIACKRHAVALVHISTDYVFNGEATSPYTPLDTVDPQTVYGRSKLAGERAIQEVTPDIYAIFRTSWLYSCFGHNFLKTMLRLGVERDVLSVVNDQTGVPTSAHAFAKALLLILPQLNPATNGVYHYSNTSPTTWYGFATEIFKLQKSAVRVAPVSSDAYPTAAKRPAYSVMDTSLTADTFGVQINTWQEELKKVLNILKL